MANRVSRIGERIRSSRAGQWATAAVADDKVSEWLDTLALQVAPGFALRRIRDRNVVHLFNRFLRDDRFGGRRYRGASQGRLDTENVIGGSADFFLESDFSRREMVERARQLERDNVIASSLLDRAEEQVIGTGIKPQARTEDPEWNKRAEELFTEWAEERADVRELSTLWDLQRLWYRSNKRDGGAFVVKLARGSLQSLEADQIAAPHGTEFLPTMVDGVETDRFGKPIRFHVIDDFAVEKLQGHRQSTAARVVVSAEDMLYHPRIKRVGQTRGESVFAQSFWLFEQLDGTLEATTVAARMAACLGLIYTTEYDHFKSLKKEKGRDGIERPEFSMEPGFQKTLRPGEKVEQVKPEHPSQNMQEHMVLIGRFVGLPLGLPLELSFMDFSRTNFHSARSALKVAERSFRCSQRRLIARILRPIWRWKIKSFVREGLLEERPDMLSHRWIPPGWPYLDPVKEAQGQLLSLDMGTTTLSEIAASLGMDWEQLLEQRKLEIAKMREAGLPDVRSTLSRAEEEQRSLVESGG